MTVMPMPTGSQVVNEPDEELPPLSTPMRIPRVVVMEYVFADDDGKRLDPQPGDVIDVEKVRDATGRDDVLRERLGYLPPTRMRTRAFAFILNRDRRQREREQARLTLIKRLVSDLASLSRPML